MVGESRPGEVSSLCLPLKSFVMNPEIFPFLAGSPCAPPLTVGFTFPCAPPPLVVRHACAPLLVLSAAFPSRLRSFSASFSCLRFSFRLAFSSFNLSLASFSSSFLVFCGLSSPSFSLPLGS